MSGRFQPLNGADSAQGLADAIALVEALALHDARLTDEHQRVYGQTMHPKDYRPSRCIACSEPALPDSPYCTGHDRIGEYRVTDDRHFAANE